MYTAERITPEAANAAIRLNPNLAKPYVVLAMIDDFGGNEKDAERNYRKALEIDPNDLQARLQLANAFVIHNVPYYWKKGKIEPWKKEENFKAF